MIEGFLVMFDYDYLVWKMSQFCLGKLLPAQKRKIVSDQQILLLYLLVLIRKLFLDLERVIR